MIVYNLYSDDKFKLCALDINCELLQNYDVLGKGKYKFIILYYFVLGLEKKDL